MQTVTGIAPISTALMNNYPWILKTLPTNNWFTAEDKALYQLSDEITTFARVFNFGVINVHIIEHFTIRDIDEDEVYITQYFNKCKEEAIRLGAMNDTYTISSLNWFGNNNTIPTVQNTNTVFYIIDRRNSKAWQCFGHDTGSPPAI